jgi:hypothetical protein
VEIGRGQREHGASASRSPVGCPRPEFCAGPYNLTSLCNSQLASGFQAAIAAIFTLDKSASRVPNGARCIRWGNRAPSADRKASSPTAASTPWHCRVRPWRRARDPWQGQRRPTSGLDMSRSCRSQSATSGQAGLGRCSFSTPALLWPGQPARPPPRWLSGVADIIQGQVHPVPCRMPVRYTLPVEIRYTLPVEIRSR